MVGVLLVFLFAIPISYFTGFDDISKIDGRLLHPIYASRALKTVKPAVDTGESDRPLIEMVQVVRSQCQRNL